MALDPQYLKGVKPELAQVLTCIASCVSEISVILRSAGSEYCGSSNVFGDQQLEVDVQLDKLMFERLGSCSAVQAAASEEQPELKELSGSGYTVVFDPLDGSSIMSANFAVGTIFGVWPGGSPVGRPGRQQVAAGYAVYGPQTVLVWAKPKEGASAAEEAQPEANGDAAREQHAAAAAEAQTVGDAPAVSSSSGGSNVCCSSANVAASHEVQEFVLQPDGTWRLRRSGVTLAPVSKTYAAANLRAAADNAEYMALVRRWIEAAYTLRYTGGMVPDVHHMFAKGSGVFCNPCSEAAPAKLRLLFECAPLAFVVEAAGGSSTTGQCSVLDVDVRSINDRSKICIGSSQLVEESLPAMQAA